MRNKSEDSPVIGVNLIADPHAGAGPRHARRRRGHKGRGRLRAVARDNPLDYADVADATSRPAVVPPPPGGTAHAATSVGEDETPGNARTSGVRQLPPDPTIMFASRRSAGATTFTFDDVDATERAPSRKEVAAGPGERLVPVASLTPKRRHFGFRKTVIVLLLVTTAVGLVVSVVAYYAAPELFDTVRGNAVEYGERLMNRVQERGIAVWPR